MLPRSYRAMTCRERELTLDHIHTFLTTQGHGGPPQMRDQVNAGAISETTQTWKTIHTIHAPIYANKANMKGWYDGQMIFGDLRGLQFLTFVLQVRKNPEKPHPGNMSRPRIEPGPLCDRHACYPLLHGGGHKIYNDINTNYINYSFFGINMLILK